MPDLIINKKNITKILAGTYAKLDKGWISLLEIPIEKSMDINAETVNILHSLKYEGIYVTLSKDYPELIKIFQKKNVDFSKLAFIDGISRMYNTKEIKAPNITYVEGPLSTNEIAETIKKVSNKIKGNKKFVFLDSVTTVLLYNSLEKTLEFSNFITKTLKELGIAGVIVSVTSGFANKELTEALTKISDEIITI